MKYYATITYNESGLYLWKFWYPRSVDGPKYGNAHVERFWRISDVVNEIIDSINSITRHSGGYYTDGKDRPCLIELNVITNYNYNISGEVFGRELTIMDKALGL